MLLYDIIEWSNLNKNILDNSRPVAGIKHKAWWRSGNAGVCKTSIRQD